MSDIFGGISDAKPSVGGNYVRAGHYVFLIDAIKLIKTRKGPRAVVSELTTLMVIDDNEGQGHRPHEQCAYFISENDSFLGNVKAYFSAICECDDAEIDEKACAAICKEGGDADANPMGGTAIEVQATDITLNSGKPFTRVRVVNVWSKEEVEEQMDEKEFARYADKLV